MKQFQVTPSMGKRLIAKGIAAHPVIQAVLKKGTLVIIAGSTNGYVAEELLKQTHQGEGFSRKGFRRGFVAPSGVKVPSEKLQGDVIFVDGKYIPENTVFDVIDELKNGDVILKGANAVNVLQEKAAVYIGDPKAGTIGAATLAVIGRRVQLIIPVGLEKRVIDDIDELVACCNDPTTEGPRMMPMAGEVFTELDAIETLTGAQAILLAAGGIYGAEGCVFLGVEGAPEELSAAENVFQELTGEPPCEI